MVGDPLDGPRTHIPRGKDKEQEVKKVNVMCWSVWCSRRQDHLVYVYGENARGPGTVSIRCTINDMEQETQKSLVNSVIAEGRFGYLEGDLGRCIRGVCGSWPHEGAGRVRSLPQVRWAPR